MRRRAAGSASRVSGGLRSLEQRHLDLIGLGLIAVGVYLGFVLFVGWDGGRVGSGAETALAYLVGDVAGVVPLVLAGIGVALLLRPLIPAPGAINAGAVCLLAGLLLAYASQTAALGPERPHRHGYFDPGFFSHHGGAVGETLYWAAATLFQRPGAHILAVLLVVAGLLLLSGTTFSAIAGRGASARAPGGQRRREMARAARETRAERDEGLVMTEADATEPFDTGLLGPDDEDGHEIDDAGDRGRRGRAATARRRR